MIRAEMWLRRAEGLRADGDAAAAWRAAGETLADLAVAAPTFTQPTRWTRLEDLRAPATTLLVALAQQPHASEDLAAVAARLAGLAAAADRVAERAAAQSAAAAITLLRGALHAGLPVERLGDPAFERLRREPGFAALGRR
jgi:hypothetical protein